MKPRRYWGLMVVLSLLLTACGQASGPEASATPLPEPTVVATTEATTTVEPDSTETVRQLTILYTSDEHGWMEATDESGGAAGLMGLWRQQEGYTLDGPFLVLSGGDMWTGPAISTWFNGESMTGVMNAMGYDAAAIGNHEFDFGLDTLAERAAQAEFPFLSANLRDRETGQVAEVALPYVIREVNGVRVGIIGLTTVETPQTTRPSNVADFDFAFYGKTLAEFAPQAREDGAQLLVVVGHICLDEMRALAPKAAELGVAVVGGGHCHQRVANLVDGVALIEAGANLEAYAKVELAFDTTTDKVVSLQASTHNNPADSGASDPEIAALVADWRAQTDEALSHVIGYVEEEIPHRSNELYNLVTDAWLWAYPTVDIAMSNRGGFRQAIPAGEITLATIVGVLPFDNTLVDVELTGEQLIGNLQLCPAVLAGMSTRGGYALTDGTPIDRQATYHVLVNDFIYAGGDGFRLSLHDPDAYQTGIDWRQPVIDWIVSLDTSPDNPLDQYLDPSKRQR